MTPICTAPYREYRTLRDSELNGELIGDTVRVTRRLHCFDIPRTLNRKFPCRAFVVALGAVANAIRVILLGCSPQEIRRCIVGWIAVFVACLHPIGAWAGKRKQYKMVDILPFSPRSLSKDNRKISAVAGDWFSVVPLAAHAIAGLPVILPATPNASIITDAVAGESLDLPIFDRLVILFFGHGSLLYSDCVLASAGSARRGPFYFTWRIF